MTKATWEQILEADYGKVEKAMLAADILDVRIPDNIILEVLKGYEIDEKDAYRQLNEYKKERGYLEDDSH